MSDIAILAMALNAVEGLGRVSVGRLIQKFGTLEAIQQLSHDMLQRYLPHRGTAKIIENLQDTNAMEGCLEAARKAVARLAANNLSVCASGDAAWPESLNSLDIQDRPLPLYIYGSLDALMLPSVGFFMPPETADPLKKEAIRLAERVLEDGMTLCTGISSDLDAELQSLCGSRPSVLVAHCGFARVSGDMRPTISRVRKAGGVLLSAFPLEHGPFKHDAKDRALMMAALSACCVFVTPAPGSPDWKAMEWCHSQSKSVFAWGIDDHDLPDYAHKIQGDRDLDWVLLATRLASGMPLA